MSIATRYIDGAPEYYDTNTSETVWRASSLAFADDFHRHKDYQISRDRLDAQEYLEPGQDEVNEKLFDYYGTGLPWDTVETMSDAVELVQTREAYAKVGVNDGDVTQLAVLYWGDSLILSAGKDLVIEARVKLATLPTGEGGEQAIAYIGLASEHNATADSITTSAWFRLNGSGEVWLEADDTTTDNGPTQSGVTVTATEWHIYRMAFHGTNCEFSIDGVEVGNMTFAPTELLQPYFRAEKTKATANTAVARMHVDYFKAWASRA